MTCVYTFSWMDRFLLIILIDPISRELKVSNTEVGLLTGFAASLIYATAGIPIARLADRGSRRTIITAAVGAWSALTALAGISTSFLGLALARFGVAVASAGCSPAAYSMISDYFPQARRGAAIAIYSLGISIGMWAGLTLGGVLEDRFGWRSAFLMIGLPGLILAGLFRLVVREPERGRHDADQTEAERQYSLREAAVRIVRHPAFLAIAFGFALLSAANSAFENWAPTYMIRVSHMSSTEVGSLSGLFQGATGFLGALIVGLLADRLGPRDRRWYLWLPIAGFAVMGPATLFFFHSQGPAAYLCYFVIELSASAYSAPLFTAGQLLLPPRLRALGMAVMLFVLNVIGMGAGPFLTGWISDLLTARGAAEGLAPAISLMQVSGVLGVASLLLAAVRLKADE
jgi:predicted MFS family arabinose efflux permease